jgi:hypothetical protein
MPSPLGWAGMMRAFGAPREVEFRISADTVGSEEAVSLAYQLSRMAFRRPKWKNCKS